ncbi:MAG: hypothetical protein K2G47_09335 [Muribaculum sp.]|nr:hypothetical protein [Muribaculum sp.]
MKKLILLLSVILFSSVYCTSEAKDESGRIVFERRHPNRKRIPPVSGVRDCDVYAKDYAGFNDKTSSIRVFNFLDPNTYYKPHVVSSGIPSTLPLPGYLGSRLRTCLISYEDSNYRGKVLYCIADYSSTADMSKPETATHQDRRLKNLGWNDKISSVVFRIVTMQDIEKGIYPSH